jgi:hypothetical protein
MRQHIVIVYINAVWPTINEPGRRRSYVNVHGYGHVHVHGHGQEHGLGHGYGRGHVYVHGHLTF